MTALTKKAFREKLRDFRAANVGAACFRDSQGNTFCANNMDQQQAQKFAQQHHMTFLGQIKVGQACGLGVCP
jgi:hypothetical protein